MTRSRPPPGRHWAPDQAWSGSQRLKLQPPSDGALERFISFNKEDDHGAASLPARLHTKDAGVLRQGHLRSGDVRDKGAGGGDIFGSEWLNKHAAAIFSAETGRLRSRALLLSLLSTLESFFFRFAGYCHIVFVLFLKGLLSLFSPLALSFLYSSNCGSSFVLDSFPR